MADLPTPRDDNQPDLERAVQVACAASGLDASRARLLRHYSNAIFHLPAENAVARVTVGNDAPVRVDRTHSVTRWLTEERDFPATQPLPHTSPVQVSSELMVSFWTYYNQPADTHPPTSAHLAALLRRLHRLDAPPCPLPSWVPLSSLLDTVDNRELSASLTYEERKWTKARIADVRSALAGLDWPLGKGLIHGDAWAGNLLWTGSPGPRHVVLGDWDWVSIGPYVVDLIPTWHAAKRYGKDSSWIRQFVDVYGYDLEQWEGYRVLLAMRDMVQLTGPIRRANAAPQFRRALRQRLDDMRSGHTDTVWTAL